MSEDNPPYITTDSEIIEFGFLITVLILPAFGIYYELFDVGFRDIKTEYFGWNWVFGNLGLSIVALSIGLFILVKKIILALIKRGYIKKKYKKE